MIDQLEYAILLSYHFIASFGLSHFGLICSLNLFKC